MLVNGGMINDVAENIWSSFSVSRVRVSTRLILHYKISTVERLMRRRFQVKDPRCKLYGEVNEDRDHLFFKFRVVLQVWALIVHVAEESATCA